MERIENNAIEQEEQIANDSNVEQEQDENAVKAQELMDMLNDPEFLRAYKKSRPDIYGRRVVSKEEKKKKKAKRRMVKKSRR